jgi:hypothetical protein
MRDRDGRVILLLDLFFRGRRHCDGRILSDREGVGGSIRMSGVQGLRGMAHQWLSKVVHTERTLPDLPKEAHDQKRALEDTSNSKRDPACITSSVQAEGKGKESGVDILKIPRTRPICSRAYCDRENHEYRAGRLDEHHRDAQRPNEARAIRELDLWRILNHLLGRVSGEYG